MIKIGSSPLNSRTSYSDVAVILPAHNEAQVVGETVKSFISALPGCIVVVCDNRSTDSTAEAARKAGALVIDEPALGKGNAVRRLLATVDAELYVMADADTTYDANAARDMIALMEQEHLDMVTGVRKHVDQAAYRRGHILGNIFFNKLFSNLFKTKTQDVFSGYRVLSGRFARALPVQAVGFEIETEMSAVASILKLSIGEHPVRYLPRPTGSHSKLSTYRDGIKILRTYIRLLRHFYPKRFYGFLAIIIGISSLFLGVPVVVNFFETGLVPRLPTAVLASSLGILSMLSIMIGLILDSIAKGKIELRQLIFLIYRK